MIFQTSFLLLNSSLQITREVLTAHPDFAAVAIIDDTTKSIDLDEDFVVFEALLGYMRCGLLYLPAGSRYVCTLSCGGR